jgi:hypothetical protein
VRAKLSPATFCLRNAISENYETPIGAKDGNFYDALIKQKRVEDRGSNYTTLGQLKMM